MKPIYKTLELVSATLQVSLALQAKVSDGTEESQTPIPADILDILRVELVAPNISGARDLINSGECTMNGNQLGIALATNDWLKGGVYRLQVIATFGTQTMVIYGLDVKVPRYNEIDNETQEYEDTVTVVSTVGGGAQSVTHAKLVEMRDNEQLVAGAWYRITDFVTTVANKANARSAGHAFDILVRALDSSTIDENARAIQHDGDTYFADCNLAAWELKYCIDNNAKRFSWADQTNGKGVIWFMRDEWNNSAFYDFKNVQFKRWAVNEIQDANGNKLDDPTSTFAYAKGTQDIRYGYQGENYINEKYTFVVSDAENFDWYYAFTWITENDDVEDATIVGKTLLADDGFSYGVHDNERGACFVINSEISADLMRDLDNGVEVATYTYEGGVFYGIYGTKTGNDCSSWTCGNNCYSWTCGNSCYSWTCGNDCYSWTCGNRCYSWTCGNGCSSWTCGNDCSSWTCGNDCYSWTCGNDCYSWTCGNSCYSWTCGNDCFSWTCGNDCSFWTCGNDCYSWTCGNSCSFWTCGNDCSSWTCGNNCSSWTCGNDCSSWTCGNNYRYFAIENGVKYVDISCTVATSDSAYAQNILIHSGVNGTANRHVTCKISTTNNDFLTEFGTVVQGTIS